MPIPDVNIFISGTDIGVKTDKSGYYKIGAKVGDVINYSHVRFKPITIIVEDVTNVLNVEM